MVVGFKGMTVLGSRTSAINLREAGISYSVVRTRWPARLPHGTRAGSGSVQGCYGRGAQRWGRGHSFESNYEVYQGEP